ncbi:MAG: hypothetical protein WAL90_06150 [Desulfobacterales bacterium]
MAARLLAWRYQRLNMAVPAPEELAGRAQALVEEAHRIARERGRNVLSIMKDLAGDLKRK